MKVGLVTGYGDIAAALFDAVTASGLGQVCGVLTRASASEVVDLAGRRGVTCWQLPVYRRFMPIPRACALNPVYAAAVATVEEELRAAGLDLLLVFGFSVLPEGIVGAPTRGCVNLHPSELPRYRGAFALQAQILAGEAQFRLTAHQVTCKIDDGPILSRSPPLPISDEDTSSTLTARSLPHLPALVADAMRALDAPPAFSAAQSAGAVPTAWGFKFRREIDSASGQSRIVNHGVLRRLRVDWDRDRAVDVLRAIRAFDTFGAFTDADGVRYILRHAHLESHAVEAPPGTVLAALPGHRYHVQASDATLAIEAVAVHGAGILRPGLRLLSITEPATHLGLDERELYGPGLSCTA